MKIRNTEADYTETLEVAKQGKFAFSKGGLRNQIVVLTAEVKRLEEVVDRQQKDNGLLYKEVQ